MDYYKKCVIPRVGNSLKLNIQRRHLQRSAHVYNNEQPLQFCNRNRVITYQLHRKVPSWDDTRRCGRLPTVLLKHAPNIKTLLPPRVRLFFVLTGDGFKNSRCWSSMFELETKETFPMFAHCIYAGFNWSN